MSGQIGRPSPRQLAYIAKLCIQWGLDERALDWWCQHRFRRAFIWISHEHASKLIDEMLTWEALPLDLRRMMGQPPLPGLARHLGDLSG